MIQELIIKPKLLVIGHARHGKDTVCELLAANYGFKYDSSSAICNRAFIFDALKDKYGYVDESDCFNDRHNHRGEWFDLISEFNKTGTELADIIFATNDIYCGLRNYREFDVVKIKYPDIITLYVDASVRLKTLESNNSFNIPVAAADIIIDNNSTLTHTIKQLDIFMENLMRKI